jgi:predicted nucleotidyltransferase
MTATALSLSASDLSRIHEIAARHGVRDVRLFGSHARGQAAPQSDIDLLVRLDPGRGFRDFMDFCDELEEALGRRVDVVTEDGLSPFIRDRVLAEAVSL